MKDTGKLSGKVAEYMVSLYAASGLVNYTNIAHDLRDAKIAKEHDFKVTKVSKPGVFNWFKRNKPMLDTARKAWLEDLDSIPMVQKKNRILVIQKEIDEISEGDRYSAAGQNVKTAPLLASIKEIRAELGEDGSDINLTLNFDQIRDKNMKKGLKQFGFKVPDNTAD